MEHTKEFRETYNKILVEHYGDISSWKTDHWKHSKKYLDLVTIVTRKDWIEKQEKRESIEAEWKQKWSRRAQEEHESIQSKLRKANNLLVCADKKEHETYKELLDDQQLAENKDGIDYIVEYLTKGGDSLLVDALEMGGGGNKWMQKENEDLQAYIEKKPVGRSKNQLYKILFPWMDYLVLELGSKNKAVKYVCDFPRGWPKKPLSLQREYAKYCEAKGGG